jgi:transposase InsO family protein
VVFAKLYTTKTAIAAADLLNDRVLPFYQQQEVRLLRIFTDRGSEYCGKGEQHDYQLYLAVNDIHHTRTKAQSPQTNGISERFHKTNPERVLPSCVPQEDLHDPRGTPSEP